MTFEIGQFVRINMPGTEWHLHEALIEYISGRVYYLVLKSNGGHVYCGADILSEIKEEQESFIVSGATAKPRKEWQPDVMRDDIDVMDVTRGLLG
jgi:hypothetical protein